MTITEDHQTTAAEFVYDPCPAWCTGQHDDDRGRHREHMSAARFERVYVSQWQDEGQQSTPPAVEVYVTGDETTFTPAQARELAAELVRLADIAEGWTAS